MELEPIMPKDLCKQIEKFRPQIVYVVYWIQVDTDYRGRYHLEILGVYTNEKDAIRYRNACHHYAGYDYSFYTGYWEIELNSKPKKYYRKEKETRDSDKARYDSDGESICSSDDE